MILASASPRRAELLALLDVDFRVVPADVDESTRPGEDAATYVARLAREKAAAVATREPGETVIAADTAVVLADGTILGKPTDEADARRLLRLLSGTTHTVLTGVAVAAGERRVDAVERTEVTFVPLTDADIDAYVATGEPLDKAGAYGIQGRGGRFVARIDGSYHNVVGLPLHTLATLLAELAPG